MNHFINGLELASLAVSSDLPLKAWEAISEIPRIDSTLPISIKSKVCEIPTVMGSNCKVIAFGSSPASTVRNFLQDKEDGKALLPAENCPLFHFLCTKKHPTLSIHKAAVDLFVNLLDELSAIGNQTDVTSPVIVTGHSLGGSIASLFTLWLLDSIYSKTPIRPICITFGSPLLGDNAFQEAISEHPTWISCFLHVISNQDPIPSTLVPTTNTTQTYSCFMPFGTTLFLSEGGSACFEESGSVLELIMGMSTGNLSLDFIDYGGMLEKLKDDAIRHTNEGYMGESNINTLLEGITLQVQAAIGAIQQENTEMYITKIEKRIERYLKRKRNSFDHTKNRNENKIYMAYIEWYMKVTMEYGGYYDSYKNSRDKCRHEEKSREAIVKHKKILNHCWKHVVADIEKMPKREGETIIRTRWLNGANYRCIVEPLDMAEYYNKGKRDYVTKGRSEHYRLLEQWQKVNDTSIERKKACSLTMDSCFWAHVEEAILSCETLKDGHSSLEDKEASASNLLAFEKYAMGLIVKYQLSRDVFLEGSSFMEWWKDYKRIKGIEYKSELTAFMKNEKLRNGSLVLKEYVS